MYTVEFLISTMHQQDFSLIERMNIKSDAIIVNQCDKYEYHEIKKDDYLIKWFNVNERGTSRSRNLAFSKASADICLLVDDDEILEDNCNTIISKAFDMNEKADLITFNLETIKGNKNRYVNKEVKRLRLYNIMKYGSARLAFKREKIENARILFAPNFGPGAKYTSGEDSLFLYDCLKKKIKCYSSPAYIAKIDDSEGSSSWFKGFTEEYFYNIGQLYRNMSHNFYWVYVLKYLLTHKKRFSDVGILKGIKLMLRKK